MEAVADRTPFSWLVALEQLCLEHASGLPRQETMEEDWVGIGFRLGDLHLLVPLEEVVEILIPPEISRVPCTKPWMHGMANVRGNLLPVMNLQGYLQDRPIHMNRNSRILVVNHGGVFSGLLVDAVLGLKHFQSDQYCDELPDSDECYTEYMMNGFRLGDEHWGVFSMHRLTETPEFVQVAV